jgi:hypothetical protein
MLWVVNVLELMFRYLLLGQFQNNGKSFWFLLELLESNYCLDFVWILFSKYFKLSQNLWTFNLKFVRISKSYCWKTWKILILLLFIQWNTHSVSSMSSYSFPLRKHRLLLSLEIDYTSTLKMTQMSSMVWTIR